MPTRAWSMSVCAESSTRRATTRRPPACYRRRPRPKSHCSPLPTADNELRRGYPGENFFERLNFSEDGDRKIMIASLRYLDTFAKIDGSWYFAERKLLLDWSETRGSIPGT